jgi:hypothetical protein
MLGKSMVFPSVREACSYRAECERGSVPEGYVVRAWEATACCWCDRPATRTVRCGSVQIDPCCAPRRELDTDGRTPIRDVLPRL